MSKLELPPDRPPIGVAAGIIKTEDQINLYASIPQIAAQVIGSYSMEENIPERPEGARIFYYDDATRAAYNAFRLRNPGREAASKYLPNCIKTVHAAGQLAIISVTALEGEDPLEVLPELVEWALSLGSSNHTIDGIEINGSCPNQGTTDLLCDDVDATIQAMDSVRKRIGYEPYIILKPSALEATKIQKYKRRQLAADAIATMNGRRILSPIDPETDRPAIGVSGGYAGQSGPVIAPLARENLKNWQLPLDGSTGSLREDRQYDMISVGGVDNGYEAYNRHEHGALMVCGAQAFYRAPHPAPVAQSWARDYEYAAHMISP